MPHQHILTYNPPVLQNTKKTIAYVGKLYTVPSLLIKVEQDQVLTPDYIRGVPHDLFVDLEQSSIAVGGHNAQNEASDEVNQELTRYLNKLFDEKLNIPKTKTQVQEKKAALQDVQEQSAQTVAHEE